MTVYTSEFGRGFAEGFYHGSGQDFEQGFRESMAVGETRRMLYSVSADLDDTIKCADGIVQKLRAFRERSEAFWKEYHKDVSQIS